MNLSTYIYLKSLNEVIPLGPTIHRHEKSHFELLVGGVQEAPNTI